MKSNSHEFVSISICDLEACVYHTDEIVIYNDRNGLDGATLSSCFWNLPQIPQHHLYPMENEYRNLRFVGGQDFKAIGFEVFGFF